ncbi:MAG: hypothetical protein ACK4WM_04605, partial [Thermoflexales bacterium]
QEQARRADVLAWLSLLSGLISLATCFGIGLALIAPPLPLVAFILGLSALADAPRAERPERARLFAWVGIVGGAGMLISALVIFAALVGGFVFQLQP